MAARPTIVPQQRAEADEQEQPWQWSEQRWRGIVERVRAGKTLRPDMWPDGARCAVALSFDCDHETGELREGGESIGRLSQGQYGTRAGVPRILALLQKYSVPATFYVPAVSAMLHPDEQRRVAAEGHEIGIHGWIHERNSVLPEGTNATCRCERPTAGEDLGPAPRRHPHAVVGFLAAYARRSRATWA